MRLFAIVFLVSVASVSLTGCSMKSVEAAKLACIAEIKTKLDIDVSGVRSTWSAYAGTGGKSTTVSYSQTQDTPAVVCVTSGGVVKSLTQSQTTTIK